MVCGLGVVDEVGADVATGVLAIWTVEMTMVEVTVVMDTEGEVLVAVAVVGVVVAEVVEAVGVVVEVLVEVGEVEDVDDEVVVDAEMVVGLVVVVVVVEPEVRKYAVRTMFWVGVKLRDLAVLPSSQ